MNTIMCTMNFINAMHCVPDCLCLVLYILDVCSLNVGCTRSIFCMHTHNKYAHHSMYNFPFHLFQDGGPFVRRSLSYFSSPFLHLFLAIRRAED